MSMCVCVCICQWMCDFLRKVIYSVKCGIQVTSSYSHSRQSVQSTNRPTIATTLNTYTLYDWLLQCILTFWETLTLKIIVIVFLLGILVTACCPTEHSVYGGVDSFYRIPLPKGHSAWFELKKKPTSITSRANTWDVMISANNLEPVSRVCL